MNSDDVREFSKEISELNHVIFQLPNSQTKYILLFGGAEVQILKNSSPVSLDCDFLYGTNEVSFHLYKKAI